MSTLYLSWSRSNSGCRDLNFLRLNLLPPPTMALLNLIRDTLNCTFSSSAARRALSRVRLALFLRLSEIFAISLANR